MVDGGGQGGRFAVGGEVGRAGSVRRKRGDVRVLQVWAGLLLGLGFFVEVDSDAEAAPEGRVADCHCVGRWKVSLLSLFVMGRCGGEERVEPWK